MRMCNLRRAAGPTAVALAVTAALFSLPGRAGAAPETETRINLSQAIKRQLLLFPFDVPDGTVPNSEEVKATLTEVAGSHLMVTGKYTVTQFHKNLPPVARLHLEQGLLDADINPPYSDDNTKATKVAKAIGYDVAFIGRVDDYQYNQADNAVTLTVSGRLLDVKTGQFVAPPVVLQASSPKGGSAKEPQKALDAARAAAEQLMIKLAPLSGGVVAPPTTNQKNTDPPSKPKRNNNGWLWGLLAVGLGLGLSLSRSGGGGGGGGGGNENPPPPP